MKATARSLAVLREMGYAAEVVERFIPHTKTRKDLFGVGDVLAIHPREGILLVQCTSGANHAARVKKANAEPRLAVWLAAGGKFQVWSWRLAGKAGKRKRWTLRTEFVTPTEIVRKV